MFRRHRSEIGVSQATQHDLLGKPRYKGIPMSSDARQHKGSNLTLDDFRSSAPQVIDTGTAPSGVPAYDIEG